MRVEFREIEFAGNQEDHGADRAESSVAARLALSGLEQPIQGFQEAIGLTCLCPGDDTLDRYIELNPVRARTVPAAGDYAWSSYRQRMGVEDCWIDHAPSYLDLAATEPERRARYAQFVEQGIPEAELALMREAVQRGQLTGNQRFVDEVERVLGRRIERRHPGRPASPRE